MAFAIDLSLVIVVSFVLLGSHVGRYEDAREKAYMGEGSSEGVHQLGVRLAWSLSVVGGVLLVFLDGAGLSRVGTTPGKRLLGLWVEREGGGFPGWWRAAVRALLFVASAPVWVFSFSGMFMAVPRAPWHDVWTQTVVVQLAEAGEA